jgi:ParB-like chromosome segregation protein Spo0J
MKQICPDQLDLRLSCFRPVRAEEVEKMMSSLSKHGQLTPITAVADGERLVLIDGFKRQRSAQQLGMQTIAVSAIRACTSEAKALVYLLNRRAGFSVITEAMLIRDLIDIEGLNQVEVATLLERHKSWVSRRLAMIRALTPEVADDIKLNLLPAGVGSSLARLPLGNQVDFSATIQNHDLKSGEVGKLVDLWCKTKEPGVRQCLLESPHQALEIVTEGKEKWLLLIEAVLSKISALNQQLQKVKISSPAITGLLQRLDLALTQIQETRELVGGEHEPAD